MSLQEKLSAFRAEFESGRPPYDGIPAAAHAAMKRATDALAASGAARRIPRQGKAPDFELKDTDGTVVRLADLAARGPVVITFYRGIWCPYCNLDAQELQANEGVIRDLGATLVAISPQTASNSRKLIAQHGLTFPILHDPGNAVAATFGLRHRLPDDLIETYRGLGVDLAVFNGDDSWTLPMPARFIVDGKGAIRYAEAEADYTRRPEPAELLPVLARLALRT